MTTEPAAPAAPAEGTDPSGAPLRPLVLVRGFGGLDVADEQRNAYQGFNDGTVYPGRRGDNFIYEGFVLRALKSRRYRYVDATNVVGYYAQAVQGPVDHGDYDPADVGDATVVLDPVTADTVLSEGVPGTIWVYRYYDLDPRQLDTYGHGLVRLVDLIRTATTRHGHEFRGVDVVAHSMGGLVVRRGLHLLDEREPGSARTLVHKVVTLGTPHRGIAFQHLPRWLTSLAASDASDELASFDPDRTTFLRTGDVFDLERLLTVVGTNHASYANTAASTLNRLASVLDAGSLSTNRSDGLVKQSAAQLPGAPRTFVHKCHGGRDSLVTSREAYEICMRFFHGTHRVDLFLDRAEITRGGDLLGRSEFYLAASIKPRGLDFDLFHQSVEAENCYGPFRDDALTQGPPPLAQELAKPFSAPGDDTTGWAGEDRLLWRGWIDGNDVPDADEPEMVFRFDLYVGERDGLGIRFSDNVIFRKQYFVQVYPGTPPTIFVHTSDRYLSSTRRFSQASVQEMADEDGGAAPAGGGPPRLSPEVQQATPTDGGWTFEVTGTGFSGTFRLGVQRVED